MRKQSPIIILLVLFTLLIASCDYSPTGTNFKTIPKPVNDIEITLLDSNSSNVLRGEVLLPIKTDVGDHMITSIIGFLDDRRIYFKSYNDSLIAFDTEYYSDGEYLFSVILSTTTDSHSLAEVLGIEKFIDVDTFYITIFNSPIKTPSIKNVYIENDALIIIWEEYTQPGFEGYILKNYYSNEIIAEINDQEQTSFIDTTLFTDGNTLPVSYILSTKILGFTVDSERYKYPQMYE